MSYVVFFEQVDMSIKITSLSFLFLLLGNIAGIGFDSLVVHASLADTSQTSANNSRVLSADLNGDGIVDIKDLFQVSRAFGSKPGDVRWNSTADLNGDYVVNVTDIVLVARDFHRLLFQNDFSGTLEDWEVVNGDWYVEDGKLRGDCFQRGVILYKGDVKEDYEISCKVYVIQSPTEGYEPSDSWTELSRPEGQIAVRYEGQYEYYFCGVGAYGYMAGIGKSVGGRFEMIASGGNSGYEDVQAAIWYELKVVAVGNRITLYVNGQEICSVTDSSHATGKVGLTCVWSSVYYDDFTVKVLTTPSDTTEYPVAPFKVDGKYIVDRHGRNVVMKGFQLDSNKMSYPYRSSGLYTKEEIQRIKNWGFHFVYSAIWWGNVEDKSTGEYNLDYLYRYAEYIDMCGEENIYWIFRFRVSFDDNDPPSWTGWGRHWYVCTEEGLQRYCRFLEWAIQNLEQRFPNMIAYHLWLFPWHQGGASSSQKNFYYNNVVPAMVTAARKHTDRLLIVSTCYCKPEEFVNMKKVDDNNVVYSFCYYKPQNHGFDCYEPTWNYDENYQWNVIEPAVDFMNIHNVPLTVAEFGVRIDRKDQVDKLRLKLQILDHYHVSWCYWCYSWWSGADCHFTLFYGDEGKNPKQGIIDALIEYSKWKAK